jgi:hypothetical protein
MNDDRNQGRTLQPQADQKHPDDWQRDLNPHHLAGQNIGAAGDVAEATSGSAFNLRKRGLNVGPLDDNDLKQVPVLEPGARLQQGATYVDLTDPARVEFTATGDLIAPPNRAYVPKDRVPYQIWNRLTGKAEENPERG